MSRVSPLLTMYNVSIPQAVGTIAILISIMILERLQQRFNTASGRYYCNYRVVHNGENLLVCFNTASGRYYCNFVMKKNIQKWIRVSIPQAVGTIAIALIFALRNRGIHKFQYRKR